MIFFTFYSLALVLLLLISGLNINLAISLYLLWAISLFLTKPIRIDSPLTAFFLPWASIVIFSMLDISIYSRDFDPFTYQLIMVFTGIFMLSYLFFGVKRELSDDLLIVRRYSFELIYIIFIASCLINVTVSGFLPLVSLITTGDSRYIDFGIKSVNGLHNAFSVTLAVTSYYLYQKNKKLKYLLGITGIVIYYILVISRQNIITIMVEIFFVRCFFHKADYKKVIISLFIIMFLFGLLGNLRSGDISELVGIYEKYTWLPQSAIWGYAYSYFNVLNLDNLVSVSSAPYYDGSMFNRLVPTIFRSSEGINHENFLEVSNLNVSSAISEIYIDSGIVSVAFFAMFWGGLNGYLMSRKQTYLTMGINSTLYYCSFASFFVNNWFYLPIIAQIPFYYILNKSLLRKQTNI